MRDSYPEFAEMPSEETELRQSERSTVERWHQDRKTGSDKSTHVTGEPLLMCSPIYLSEGAVGGARGGHTPPSRALTQAAAPSAVDCKLYPPYTHGQVIRSF